MKRFLLLLPLLLLGACVYGDPDWEMLYEAELNQPIASLNETVLNSEFQDTQGNLTRVSWAQLENGRLLLLGLPAYSNTPAQVVDRTVVLTQEEWQGFCASALGLSVAEISGWSWSVAEESIGNRFTVFPATTVLDPGESVIIPDPNAPYCEFVFLPGGWELHLVTNEGVVKS